LVSLKNIITHILQIHGFEVYERDGILKGEKDGTMVTIGLFDTLTVNEIRNHARTVSVDNGQHIVCVLEASDTVEQEAQKLGLVVWRKSDLEKELGNAIVSQISQSSFGVLLETRQEAGDGNQILIENLGTEGKPIIFKSNLTRDDVREISKNTIQGFKFDLELVPHYLFQYSCSYEGKDGQNVRKQGTVSVNALTGRYSEWTHQPVLETSIEHINQMEPKIDQENAAKIAVHAIITLNTEFKEIVVERDHATIIEKATFRPDPDSIVLENQIIIMVPVWCAEGKHGVMILDGITGKVISEDYYDSH